ncbi:MAG: biotin/lipoate A/B protein ligase family protein [Bacillota bacterium]|nr:biotin/lipoate A/B protein ligase family protein [Bacillota bacterium]
MQWRIIDTGFNDGYYNMAVDEALLHSVTSSESEPVIRFYGWQPAAISIGYFQKLEDEIDIAGCAKRGIDVVRRLTGGRAVLHHQEITYSIIAPENNPAVSGSIVQSYLKISQGLLYGLKSLGIPVELVPHGVKPTGDSTAACFEAPSWYELAVEGKKLVGSAQTRKNGSLLQHGSILIDLDIDLLADTITFKSQQAKERFIKSFSLKATSIHQVMKRVYNYNELRDTLTAGFQKALDISLEQSSLTDREAGLISKLDHKYKSSQWNYHRIVDGS